MILKRRQQQLYYCSPLLLLLLSKLLESTVVLGLSISSKNNNKAGAKVVWFRDHALRLRDNEALTSACQSCCFDDDGDGSTILIPIYLWKSYNTTHPVNPRTGGSASELFTSRVLFDLDERLSGQLQIGQLVVDYNNTDNRTSMLERIQINVKLIVQELVYVCDKVGASEVYYLESMDKPLEDELRRELQRANITPQVYGGACTVINYSSEDIVVPWEEIILQDRFRSPLIPFVEYWLRHLDDKPPTEPLEIPEQLQSILRKSSSRMNNHVFRRTIELDSLFMLQGKSSGGTMWGDSVLKSWPTSEEDGPKALSAFISYLPERNIQISDEKSHLKSINNREDQNEKRTQLASLISPYLAKGVLSPKDVYVALKAHSTERDCHSFIRRIAWRDYTYAVCNLLPDIRYGEPIRKSYSCSSLYYDVEEENRLFSKWKYGETGFPLIDAGMRQLRIEGYMPQKVRLAVSTFLVEALAISWEKGMKHFEEFLVDFDLSINSNMWQNAGCVGFDPYYIGLNFRRRPYWDKDGVYVRKWLPELKDLPNSINLFDEKQNGNIKIDPLYEPWLAPKSVLTNARVILGDTYPHRISNVQKKRKAYFNSLVDQRLQWDHEAERRKDEKGRDLVFLGRNAAAKSIGMFTPKVLLRCEINE